MEKKSARSRKELAAARLSALNHGNVSTTNLMEWLAVDQVFLAGHVLGHFGKPSYLPYLRAVVGDLPKQTANTVGHAIGKMLKELTVRDQDQGLFENLALHPSDSVRCWCCYMVAADPDLGIKKRLAGIRRFAADPHFGVREVAWLAIRGAIIAELPLALQELHAWARNTDENIRRFASESTRPRGVWSPHIEILKNDPGQGLPILEHLKSDASKYVRDSVGNWLNDAAKTKPDFVRDLCRQWTKKSKTAETAYIVRRACRNLD